MTTPLTANQRSFIEIMTRSAGSERHGFELLAKHATPERFFDSLLAAGLFSAERNPEPTRGDEPGRVRVPYWPALDYLEACARTSGERRDMDLAGRLLGVVRDVTGSQAALGRSLDNYHTWGKFAEMLGLVPVALLTDADVEMIGVWLAGEFDNGLTVKALDDGLISRLLASDTPEAGEMACIALRQLTALKWVEEPGSGAAGRRKPVTVADDYWIAELLRHHAGGLGAKLGEGAAAVLLERVREVFGANSSDVPSWVARPSVENHEQNHGWRKSANLFVEALRDVVLAWIDASAESARVFVQGMLEDDSEMVRRIGVHVSNARWDVLREVLEPIIGPSLFATGHLHEAYGLLRDRFVQLDASARARVLGSIQGIPHSASARDADLRLKRAQLNWLSAIRGKGDPCVDAWYAKLAMEPGVGARDHPDFHSYMETGWGPGPSPYPPEELMVLIQQGALVSKVNAFEEMGTWRGPTVEGLVGAIEEAVQRDPVAFAEVASEFLEAKRPYQVALLRGFARAWERTTGEREADSWDKIWAALIEFSDSVVSAKEFWREAGEDIDSPTANASWIPGIVADLLKSGTKDDAKAYVPELLARGWSLLERLLDHARGGANAGDEPMAQAVNTPRGRAVEALLTHALRACRLADKASGSHVSEWQSMRPRFDAELQRCTNANFEVSTLFAAHVAQLRYLDPEWVAANIRLIFSSEHETNFGCAVAGLTYARVTRAEYRLLKSEGIIHRALSLESLGRESQERLVQYVVLAHISGDDELDTPTVSRLLDSERRGFAEHAAAFLASLGREELSEKQVERVLMFGEQLLGRFSGTSEASKKVLSLLPRMASLVRAEDPRGMRLLASVAPYVDMHNSFEFFAELDRLADERPEEVTQALRAALAAFSPSYDYRDHLKSTIRKLAKSGRWVDAVEFAITLGMLDVHRELVAAPP